MINATSILENGVIYFQDRPIIASLQLWRALKPKLASLSLDKERIWWQNLTRARTGPHRVCVYPRAVHTHTSGCRNLPLVDSVTAPSFYLNGRRLTCSTSAMPQRWENYAFPNKPGSARFKEEAVDLCEINHIRFRSIFPKHWSFSTKITVLPDPDMITRVITFPSTCLHGDSALFIWIKFQL